jgi:hypothetical protein
MAHGTVTLVNPLTSEVKNVPVGYSWTVLFFGCFPALFRSDFKNCVIMAVVLVLAGLLGVGIIPLVIFSFIYNDKMLMKDLINEGWKVRGYNGSKNLDVVAGSVGYDINRIKE